ncbi:MAG: hypothetical protein OXD01_11070 [Gammaproteobacteria bacterium]|nr:hypothetical protein [Gammaproteobacteria bacterium]
MSAEIQQAIGETPQLIGGGGVFDVFVDGNLIYSKFELNRFPKSGEIASLLDTKS